MKIKNLLVGIIVLSGAHYSLFSMNTLKNWYAKARSYWTPTPTTAFYDASKKLYEWESKIGLVKQYLVNPKEEYLKLIPRLIKKYPILNNYFLRSKNIKLLPIKNG